MTVPFFGTDREFADLRREILDAVESVLRTGQALQGPPVAELESDVAALAGRRFAVAVNSCTDALYFALVALGVGPRDEVLVTDFSFVASATCVLRCGAVPVFVDIDPATFNMDLEAAGNLVTRRTKAIVCVHLYGQMSDPAEVEAFAREHGLGLVEDAAQAIGATYEGRMAGCVGDVACLSFDPTKPVSAPGSGGMALTNDQEIVNHLRRLRYHGKDADGSFVLLGYNSQMPTLTAEVLRVNLRHNDRWIRRRREIAQRYSATVGRLDGFTVPQPGPEVGHIYHKYVIRCPDRAALQRHLASRDVETLVHYGSPLHRQPLFQEGPPVHAPHAEEASRQVLSLPIHAYLRDEEVEAVTGAILEFAGEPVAS
jgi:dTDP-4-amino-4,6-dideoxygalactose transaminase